jgi:hypothetical protein
MRNAAAGCACGFRLINVKPKGVWGLDVLISLQGNDNTDLMVWQDGGI